MVRSRSFLAVVALIALAACGQLADADSSEDASPAWDLVESLRIGSADGGEYPLASINSLLPGPDGSVLVGQAAPEVAQFDSTGDLLRVIGRSGAGPGELNTVVGIGWLADTLWVADLRNRKLAYYRADGRHLFDRGTEVGAIDGQPGVYRFPPHPLAGPWSIVQPGYAFQESTELPVFKVDREGVIADTLASMTVTMVSVDRSDPGAWRNQPFLKDQLTGISPSGSFVGLLTPAGARDGAGAVPSRDELVVWTANFDTLFARDFSMPPREVPEAEVREAYAAIAERGVDDPREQARILDDLLDGIEAPPTYAFADRLLLSDDGEAWLRLGYPAEGPRTWWVLDSEGATRASVTAPTGVTLMAIDGDRVWGVYRDELEIPYIVRYQLQRPDATPLSR